MKKCKQIVGYNDEIIDLVFLPIPASTNGHPPPKQETNKALLWLPTVTSCEYLT